MPKTFDGNSAVLIHSHQQLYTTVLKFKIIVVTCRNKEKVGIISGVQ